MRAVERAIREPLGNAGRGGSRESLRAAECIYEAREQLASFLGLQRPEHLVFTGGATAALNMAIRGTVAALKRNGEKVRVVTSVLEHNSVLRPLFDLEKRGDISLTVLAPKDDFCARLAQIPADFVVFSGKSNVNGHALALEKIAALARQKKIPFLLDGAQLIGSVPFDLNRLGADMLAVPGHKGMLGIQGGGFLAFSDEPNIIPEAVFSGGSGSDSYAREMPAVLPERLEAGTLPLVAIASMKAGAEFLSSVGLDAVYEKKCRLKRRLAEGIAALPGAVLYEPEFPDGPLLCNFRDRTPDEVAAFLDEAGIQTRAGVHCAPLMHRFLGTAPHGGVRLSPGFFTTEKDIDRTLLALSRL